MSTQRFSRRSTRMRFKPKGGLGASHGKTTKDAEDARKEALGEKPSDDRIFDTRRHEHEIQRAENRAFGLPEDAPEAAPAKQSKGRDQDFREPDLSVPAELREDEPAPVEVPQPPPRSLMGKAKAAVEKVVKRVKQLIKPPPKIVKEVIINAEPLETRVAVLEDGKLEEFTVERTNDERLVGSVYKGKVKNLEDGLKAAFVDIGFEKNAFLHYWDIIPNSFDSSVEIVERDDRKRRREKPKITQKDVPKLYPPGSEIIVQVTKGSIGTKGPRVTTNLALPGRYLVLLPNSDQSGISRKIENQEERQRLKKTVRELTIPDGMGVIIRTAGEGKRKAYFVRDLALLLDEWREIQERIQKQGPASCVFQEPDLIDRTVRDFLTEDVSRIVVDDPRKNDHIRTTIQKISPRSARKVHFYNEAQPLFDRFNVSRQLEQAFSRQVPLKSGGYLIVDETEALVAIDVNTGRHKQAGTRDHDQTILKVNMEAADEICRQLRLRNIGGIIVLDFIDMKHRRDQQLVFQRVKQGLKRDKAKTHVLPLSQLGLMEMTRQRHTESVRATLYDPCPHCKGRGVVKSAESMSVEIQRKLTQIMKARPRDESDFQLRIVCNPAVIDRMQGQDERLIIELEKKFFARIGFRPEPGFHNEQWRIFNAETNEELAHSQH
jgi:ribonuclease G